MKNKRLKFLLIHPEISRTKYNFVGIIENECLELEYISSVLKQRDYEVYFYDGQVKKTDVKTKIKKVKPDVVYVCGRTRQENFMLEYCEEAKKYNDKIITIIGGLHAQLNYERMYREYVDYILTTFDVFQLFLMVDYSIHHTGVKLEEMEGVCYQKDGTWFKKEAKPFDINRLPLPDRTYFDEHPDRYRYLELEHAAWVRTAYCCPYHCKFCQRNKMNGGKYVCRDIKDVVDEIAQIKSDHIYIVDDDFLFDADRLRTFVSSIKEKKIEKKYICYGRSDFIAKNKELMKELKEIGLYYVLVGLESIKDDNLNRYHKKSSVSNNLKTIQICNELGIHIMGMFIIDLDYEPKDFKQLYRWIKEHDLKHVAISIFTPELGTELYDKYQHRIITDNPSHWDYLHVVAKTSKMSVKRYYFYYYVLLIKLFLKAKREGVYDFIDYGDYIKSFIANIFKSKRSHDDE